MIESKSQTEETDLELWTPTQFERTSLLELFPELVALRVCGFGVVPTAVSVSATHTRPGRIVLIGIAGSYDLGRLPVGSAVWASRVTLERAGVRESDGVYRDFAALGFPFELPQGEQVGTSIELAPPLDRPAADFLTVGVASHNPARAESRRAEFQTARVEEMEGYAFALAGLYRGCRVAVVRGISNRAGDRDHRRWSIRDGLQAAGRELLEALEAGLL